MNLVTYIFKAFNVILLISILTGCKEFIEPSIADRQLTVNAPVDQSQSKNYAISFWWDEVEDALTYRLQVVTPNFDQPASLVVDTVVKSNKFTVTLEPGNYSWRVRAENGHSQTSYTVPRSFNILFSSIKQQKVRLLSPGNASLTNLSKLTLTWEALYGATKYHLQADTNGFTDTTKLVLDVFTPSLQYDLPLNKDQNYQWRIRAGNDTARAQWSSVNTFAVDRTPPGQVIVISPLNAQTATSPVALQFNATATATRYKVYVFRADSTSTYNADFPVTITANSYSFTAGTRGETVYWKVSAIDAAGNEGIASKLRNFTIH